MSTPPETDFAAQIMNAAIAFDTPAVPLAPTISPTDKIAELERQVMALKVEKRNAEKRTAERYKQMLHATRHAERTQQALKRETEDKLDSEMKAIKAFHALKQRIADLEHENAQEQRSARTFNQLQELESANNRLRVKLTQEKEAFARVQHALKQMSSKSQEDMGKFKIQSKEAYDKALTDRQKQWKEEYARQSAAATQEQAEELGSTREENERLKQQLQKSQQALEWHKVQLQQQSAQRVGIQSSPIPAGIRAGFPLPPQQSPSLTDQQKRRRLNSTGDSSHPAPKQQQGSADTAATPKRMKASTGNKQLSQNPATPTRLPQSLNPNSSLIPPVQQAQAEAQKQAILMEAQRTGTLQRFQDFTSRAHASRRNAGQSQFNIAQLWHVFSQQLAQEGSQQPSPSISGQHGSQVNASGNLAMMQNIPHGGKQFDLHSPSQISPTPPTQEARQSFSNQSPLSNLALGTGTADRTQTPQRYQQSPQSYFHNYMQLPVTSNMSYNPMLTLTAGYNANSPAIPLTDVSLGQVIPQELQYRGDDLDPFAQYPAKFQDGNLYPSPPEDLQSAQHTNVFNNLMSIPVSVSPILSHENDVVEGAAGTTCGNADYPISGNEVANGSFSAATNTSTPFPSFLEHTEAFTQPCRQQRDSSRFTQHECQQTTIDRALYPGTTQLANGNTNLTHPSQARYDARSTPHQRRQGEPRSVTTTRSSYPSSDSAPARTTVARKRPIAAPPSSIRSLAPVTGAPDFPVCLQCHEKWWNETCDSGEPCQNCSLSGTSCERPECHLEPGTCANARCSRVHEGDTRFRYVVSRPKALRRKGKMGDAVDSPVVVMRTRSGEGLRA